MFRGVPPVTSELLDLEEKKRVYGYHTVKIKNAATVIDDKKPITAGRIAVYEDRRAATRQREIRASQGEENY